MIFYKKLTQEEVLEAIAHLTVQTLPEDVKGEIILHAYDDGSIEITVVEDAKGTSLN
jgi:hypothetical protein